MNLALVASRHAVAKVPPMTLALLRYEIGLLCLAPFAIRSWRQSRAASAATASPR